MSETQAPLGIAPTDDTGAETLQRYRYQAAYSAWLAVGMLEEIPDAVAVYCEHHDDVLLELADGRCDAIQIKTQADSVAPLKGNAKPVLNALKRFIELENTFGHRMRRYGLASISGFHRAGKASSNLHHCLEQARGCTDPEDLPKPLRTLVKQIGVSADVASATVLSALTKVTLDGSLAKLEDIELRVRRAIEQLPEAANYRISELALAARAIIALAVRAGEATKGTAASDYVSYLDDPAGHAMRAAIEAKRLDKEAIRAAVLEAAEQGAALRSTGGSDVSNLPPDLGVARLKMDVGGLPVHTVRLLDDLRASAEDEIGRRLYRDGPEKVDAEYDHAQVLVRTLAEDSRLAVRTGAAPYGQDMYADFRRRLRERCASDPAIARGLSDEHLTGIATILTELCQVWWSEPFDVEVAR